MKRFTSCMGALLLLTMLSLDAGAKKGGVIRIAGGTSVPELGLVIDASHDKRLDRLVPGYKIINVAIVNESLNIISLDPEKDLWTIKLAGEGRSFPAIHDLRSKDPKAWTQIPEKVRELVAYPLVLPIGGRESVDLFLPNAVDVERFNELSVYLKSIDTKIEVLVRQ